MAILEVDDSYIPARIAINNETVATDEIIESIRITYGCSDGNAPGFGSTFSPHCDVSINSNEIADFPNLSLIKLGAKFVVYFEIDGTETVFGQFYIEEAPQYTDDYNISFSGEGMLGSLLANTKVDYDLMHEYTQRGVLTLNEARSMLQDQFNIIITFPQASDLPQDIFTDCKIVVPLKGRYQNKKWDSTIPFKKRFLPITGREFLAGMAVMMGCNVVEDQGLIVFRPIASSASTDDYFTADSYVSDYKFEQRSYAPNSMNLTTYETTEIITMSDSSMTTRGFCIKDECNCNNVYSNLGASAADNPYEVDIDCQWIGRSFETFYFSGDVHGNSGIYEDATPIRTYHPSAFAYYPADFDFSGWHEHFIPGNVVVVQIQIHGTDTNIGLYIMEMTVNWEGTITTQISSNYNGELKYKTPTRANNTTTTNHVTLQIGSKERKLSNVINDGVVDADTIVNQTATSVNMFQFYEDELIGD